MGQVEYEAFNVTLPFQNSSGMVDQAAIVATQASQAVNLSDYFGGLGEGHYYTFYADGAPMYVSFGVHGGQPIDERTAGRGAAVCWPLANGQQLPGRLLGGREVGTAYATNTQVASGVIVYVKVPSFLGTGVSPTGMLRIYRSSVGPGQDRREFKPPGF